MLLLLVFWFLEEEKTECLCVRECVLCGLLGEDSEFVVRDAKLQQVSQLAVAVQLADLIVR